MKSCGNAGSRIINFKTIYGITKDNFEGFINKGSSVMKIKLGKNSLICFTDMDNDSHMITNYKNEIADVMVFGSNIIFNQEQVNIKDI